MTRSYRLIPGFLALLLLLGQLLGVLHQLGHGLADAGRVIALAEAGVAPAAGTSVPAGDDANCLLCLGLGGHAALHQPPGFVAAPELGFARPLADLVEAHALLPGAAPIRGPPAAFSRIA